MRDHAAMIYGGEDSPEDAPSIQTDLVRPPSLEPLAKADIISLVGVNEGPHPDSSALRIFHCAGRDIFKPAKIHFRMRLAYEPRFT